MGRNLDNVWFVFWEKWCIHKFIRKFSVPLLQHWQIIFSAFICLKGSVIFLEKLATKIKKKNLILFFDLVFDLKFTRNAKNYLDILFQIYIMIKNKKNWFLKSSFEKYTSIQDCPLKLIYSEKATKFCKISSFYLSGST